MVKFSTAKILIWYLKFTWKNAPSQIFHFKTLQFDLAEKDNWKLAFYTKTWIMPIQYHGNLKVYKTNTFYWLEIPNPYVYMYVGDKKLFYDIFNKLYLLVMKRHISMKKTLCLQKRLYSKSHYIASQLHLVLFKSI